MGGFSSLLPFDCLPAGWLAGCLAGGSVLGVSWLARWEVPSRPLLPAVCTTSVRTGSSKFPTLFITLSQTRVNDISSPANTIKPV